MKGKIIKGISGFYYVKAEDGNIYSCRARGIFKKDNMIPFVGDDVTITLLPDGNAVIDSIAKRKNEFIRPPVSNIDIFIIVTAAKDPDPNYMVIDRFLVMAEKSHTDAVICINKTDIAEESRTESIKENYRDIYPVFCVSGITGNGIKELREYIKGRTAALAGPSGAGKSTILNAIKESELMQTGCVSRKTGRGRHTTRHVEIFGMDDGGLLFDTPGFTSFDVLEADEEELDSLFPDIRAYRGNCRYDDCRHLKEPGCAVRQAVSEGKISKERYRSYAAQLLEIREREKKRYL